MATQAERGNVRTSPNGLRSYLEPRRKDRVEVAPEEGVELDMCRCGNLDTVEDGGGDVGRSADREGVKALEIDWLNLHGEVAVIDREKYIFQSAKL